MARGKLIGNEGRDIIYKVYLYFASEAQQFEGQSGYFQKIQERVSQATGVSVKFVYKLLKERGKSLLLNTNNNMKVYVRKRQLVHQNADKDIDKHISKVPKLETQEEVNVRTMQLADENADKDIDKHISKVTKLETKKEVNVRKTQLADENPNNDIDKHSSKVPRLETQEEPDTVGICDTTVAIRLNNPRRVYGKPSPGLLHNTPNKHRNQGNSMLKTILSTPQSQPKVILNTFLDKEEYIEPTANTILPAFVKVKPKQKNTEPKTVKKNTAMIMNTELQIVQSDMNTFIHGKPGPSILRLCPVPRSKTPKKDLTISDNTTIDKFSEPELPEFQIIEKTVPEFIDMTEPEYQNIEIKVVPIEFDPASFNNENKNEPITPHIADETRQVVFNVYLYFVNEANSFRKLENRYFQKVQERVSKACCVSRRYIQNLLKNTDVSRNNTPKPIGIRPPAKTIKTNKDTESNYNIPTLTEPPPLIPISTPLTPKSTTLTPKSTTLTPISTKSTTLTTISTTLTPISTTSTTLTTISTTLTPISTTLTPISTTLTPISTTLTPISTTSTTLTTISTTLTPISTTSTTLTTISTTLTPISTTSTTLTTISTTLTPISTTSTTLTTISTTLTPISTTSTTLTTISTTSTAISTTLTPTATKPIQMPPLTPIKSLPPPPPLTPFNKSQKSRSNFPFIPHELPTLRDIPKGVSLLKQTELKMEYKPETYLIIIKDEDISEEEN